MRHASEHASQLVRAELRLALAEVTQKGKWAGAGAGLLGGSGVVALYGAAAALAALMLGLAKVMPAWAAALLLAVVLFLAAGVLALLGRRNIQRATPPVPEQAAESTEADVDEVKERAHQ